jgi:hypothetical protein
MLFQSICYMRLKCNRQCKWYNISHCGRTGKLSRRPPRTAYHDREGAGVHPNVENRSDRAVGCSALLGRPFFTVVPRVAPGLDRHGTRRHDGRWAEPHPRQDSLGTTGVRRTGRPHGCQSSPYTTHTSSAIAHNHRQCCTARDRRQSCTPPQPLPDHHLSCPQHSCVGGRIYGWEEYSLARPS